MVWASLAGLVTGRFGFNDIAGPVGTATVISQAASIGLKENFLAAFNNILYVMMIITVNLGVVNLLPLPALDGGRLIFLIIEGIRRKPINRKYEGWVNAAGFALLMVLMVVVTFSDILRLITGKGLGA
jgi:regulator of sigma E protease